MLNKKSKTKLHVSPLNESIQVGCVNLKFSISGPRHYCPDFVSSLRLAIVELNKYLSGVEEVVRSGPATGRNVSATAQPKHRSQSQRRDSCSKSPAVPMVLLRGQWRSNKVRDVLASVGYWPKTRLLLKAK